MHQINQHRYILSHYRNGVANLRLQIPEFLLDLTSSFNIIGIIRKSNLNGSSGRKLYTEVEVDNEQILTLKIICLSYRLPAHLGLKSTCRLLEFTTKKRDVLCLLSMFGSQENLDSYFQSIALKKYLFITQLELGI